MNMKVESVGNVHRFNNWGESVANPVFARNDLLTNNKNKVSEKTKTGVFVTTALATAAGLALIMKYQKVPFKNLFKLKIPTDSTKNLHIAEKEIGLLGGASAVGGLLGGAIFDDKKHFKSKVQEVLSQLVGNVAVPLGFVSAASRICKKCKVDKLGKVTAGFVRVLATFAALGIGIPTGNKVGDFINSKLYKKEVDRKIKASDFAPHVDDLALAVTLMAGDGILKNVMTRLVPIALLMPGLEIGRAKEGQNDK
jgi:hypothetical protein